jgi:hypothetical protein
VSPAILAPAQAPGSAVEAVRGDVLGRRPRSRHGQRRTVYLVHNMMGGKGTVSDTAAARALAGAKRAPVKRLIYLGSLGDAA